MTCGRDRLETWHADFPPYSADQVITELNRYRPGKSPNDGCNVSWCAHRPQKNSLKIFAGFGLDNLSMSIGEGCGNRRALAVVHSIAAITFRELSCRTPVDPGQEPGPRHWHRAAMCACPGYASLSESELIGLTEREKQAITIARETRPEGEAECDAGAPRCADRSR
jgi:hypothetical protein